MFPQLPTRGQPGTVHNRWNDFSDLPGFQHLPRLITVLGISMMINLAAQTTKKKV